MTDERRQNDDSWEQLVEDLIDRLEQHGHPSKEWHVRLYKLRASVARRPRQMPAPSEPPVSKGPFDGYSESEVKK